MVMDPFGDYKTHGYLQNIHDLPLGNKLKMHEHQDFMFFLPDTLKKLSQIGDPNYDDLLHVHKSLFGEIYPTWAGKDRQEITPDRTVYKGNTEFAQPYNIRKAFDIGMKEKNFGKMLGHLAYAHPFLDGNGRAIFTFFEDQLRRYEFHLEWNAIPKNDFLKALDMQIARPDGDVLDKLLKPHLNPLVDKNKKSSLLNIQWLTPNNQRKKK